MLNDNRTTKRNSETLLPQALYRGLYMRVAKNLGVDPSYVSRVARGERNSIQVENALRQEILEISRKLGRRGAASAIAPGGQAGGRRLKSFVRRNRPWLRQEWLRQSQSHPTFRALKLSSQKRVSPVMPLLDEAVKMMRLSLREMPTAPMKAAEQHGRVRRRQKYSPIALCEDYNLIRRCMTNLAEKHFYELDTHLLFHDLAQLGEVMDVQLQHALRNFLGAPN
ncbi:MAG TPA: hypothetical protein VMO80_01830 [Terriglobales bacterium]|jgi:hypothetical protein|nr:hypothetical protein [Terriglobales bacterium]